MFLSKSRFRNINSTVVRKLVKRPGIAGTTVVSMALLATTLFATPVHAQGVRQDQLQKLSRTLNQQDIARMNSLLQQAGVDPSNRAQYRSKSAQDTVGNNCARSALNQMPANVRQKFGLDSVTDIGRFLPTSSNYAPADFPCPMFRGSGTTYMTAATAGQHPSSMYGRSCTIETNDAPQTIYAWYANAFRASAWKVQAQPSSSAASMGLEADNGQNYVTVRISGSTVAYSPKSHISVRVRPRIKLSDLKREANLTNEQVQTVMAKASPREVDIQR